MQNKIPAPTSASAAPQMNISDIYHVLFKHKWKILGFSLAGFAAAAGLYFLTPPPFQSEAKLLVRYVQDSKSPVSAAADAQVKPIDFRGENVMAAEAEILSSLDVAAAVVDVIGAEKILGKGSTTTNREIAAMVLEKGLIVDVPKKGNVMRVAYQNTNPDVVQPILRQVIDTYFKKHIEIHRNLGVLDEVLTQRTDQLRSRLSETEEELRKLKTKAGVISLEEFRKTHSELTSKLRQELFDAQIELEERQAALRELMKTQPQDTASVQSSVTNLASVSDQTLVSTNLAPTNSVADRKPNIASLTPTNTSAILSNVAIAGPKPKLPPDLVGEYKRLSARLDNFRKREQDLLTEFTPESPLVKEVRVSIAELDKQKKEMESTTPALLEETVTTAKTAIAEHKEAKTVSDLSSEKARVVGLEAKIKMLTVQFEKVRSESAGVDDVENALVQLQLKKELEETQYRYYSTSLDQARVDTTLASGKLSNISEIQSPSLPLRDSKSLKKKMGMAAGGGIALGLGLAFLLEMVLSQSIRRPGVLDSKYHLPVFLTIPQLSPSRERKRLSMGKKENGKQSQPEVNGAALVASNGNEVATEIAPWDEHHELHPFSDALRDRLASFFELKEMTHKPKLIAITSCSAGAGVTTIATGLAASLSETGEGNVLLVDMNVEDGAAHPFFQGKPACGLSDVLDHDKRPAAMVQDKLYMVHGGLADDRLPKILPKRISQLLPKLQSSDYDYIIFDMPPISQTSITPRLAGFMDMVFLVVEAEKTNRDWLKQASGMLLQSKSNIGAIFNKRRTYVPRWLHEEF